MLHTRHNEQDTFFLWSGAKPGKTNTNTQLDIGHFVGNTWDGFFVANREFKGERADGYLYDYCRKLL